MPELNLTNQELLETSGAAAQQLAWLRTGELSLALAHILTALKPIVTTISAQHEQLLDECAVFEGEGKARTRKQTPVTDQKGNVVAHRVEVENPVEFAAREAAFLGSRIRVTVPVLLTSTALINAHKEFLPDTTGLAQPNLLHLLPLLEPEKAAA